MLCAEKYAGGIYCHDPLPLGKLQLVGRLVRTLDSCVIYESVNVSVIIHDLRKGPLDTCFVGDVTGNRDRGGAYLVRDSRDTFLVAVEQCNDSALFGESLGYRRSESSRCTCDNS